MSLLKVKAVICGARSVERISAVEGFVRNAKRHIISRLKMKRVSRGKTISRCPDSAAKSRRVRADGGVLNDRKERYRIIMKKVIL